MRLEELLDRRPRAVYGAIHCQKNPPENLNREGRNNMESSAATVAIRHHRKVHHLMAVLALKTWFEDEAWTT